MAWGRRLLLVCSLTLMLPASATAGTAQDPEIADPQGDVNVESVLPQDVKTDDTQAAARAADLRAVWIAAETPQTFTLQLSYAGIPAQPDGPGTAVQTWVYFTVRGVDYRVLARLHAPALAPDPAAAQGALAWQPRFNLTRGAIDHPLTGSLEPERGTIVVFVPKALVGDPARGEVLTRFWAVTRAGGSGPALDYAPGARLVNPLHAPAFDPAAPGLSVTPQYGRDYAFGRFDGAFPARLQVSAPPALDVREGRSGIVAVTIKNEAEATDTVQIGLSRIPRGWSADASPVSLTLAPGQSRSVVVTLRPNAGAEESAVLELRITSALGADQQPAVALSMEPAPVRERPSPPAAPPPPPATEPEAEKDSTPWPGALAALAAGALAALRRRR